MKNDMHGIISLMPVVLLLILFPAAVSWAETLTLEIKIKDHLFYPSEIEAPAGKKIKLLIVNEDPTPEEFESYELNREKVVSGNSKTIVFIGPLKPGIYPFFGEFYHKTAQGKIVVK